MQRVLWIVWVAGGYCKKSKESVRGGEWRSGGAMDRNRDEEMGWKKEMRRN